MAEVVLCVIRLKQDSCEVTRTLGEKVRYHGRPEACGALGRRTVGRVDQSVLMKQPTDKATRIGRET